MTETAATEQLVEEFHTTMSALKEAVGTIIVGQNEALEQILIATLIRGHCLMTGLPGTAKTLLVRTLAQALGLDFKRIQFTPDLMPTDVTGTDLLDEDPATGRRQWRFEQGPIFTNVLLADEINRSPPKTQAALLEAMQEFRVTARGTTYTLEPPFVVLATQNPIELEGTYPLPEAQLDRFVFNVLLDYLDADQEADVVKRNTSGIDVEALAPCTTGDALNAYCDLVREVPMSDELINHAVDIVRLTRPIDARAPELVTRFVSYGASVRAATFLSIGARARALLNGRFHVIAEDVDVLAAPVLRHRVQLNYLAESEGVDIDQVIADVVGHAGS